MGNLGECEKEGSKDQRPGERIKHVCLIPELVSAIGVGVPSTGRGGSGN